MKSVWHLALTLLVWFSPLALANSAAPVLLTGAEQPAKYLPLLKGKRVGLLVNQTSVVDEQHLVDFLLAQNIQVVAIFAPEHGFRGNHDAGAAIANGTDSRTGLPVWSMYGASKKPSPEQMQALDIIMFDIQDVGVRYYTYISSMHYMLAAAAEFSKPMLVLDRPNPNGAYVDGPVLDLAFQSFVGMHPIPLLHGMTVGELALMIKGEGWIAQADKLTLTVIPVANYQRQQAYTLPIPPSPNLPNQQAIKLYPSLGFFEATPLSVGRGTDFPFQVIGYDKFATDGFAFTPVSTPGAALKPPLMDQLLHGEDLRHVPAGGLTLSYLMRWNQLFDSHAKTLFSAPDFMDKLAGTDQLRLQIAAGLSEAQIRASWQPQLQLFLKQRQAYLLYP
ncbi:exo-beta-N-acetylmuramidase NamZ family protein [Alishewanella sp. HL-SH06]|uniref:exo-beta-N-acetylmuramidase NamZ family protein n=1 Tax=Alishewanella sp. HL-SH06 TaxID=3461144 RepID=UPI0040418B56